METKQKTVLKKILISGAFAAAATYGEMKTGFLFGTGEYICAWHGNNAQSYGPDGGILRTPYMKVSDMFGQCDAEEAGHFYDSIIEQLEESLDEPDVS